MEAGLPRDDPDVAQTRFLKVVVRTLLNDINMFVNVVR